MAYIYCYYWSFIEPILFSKMIYHHLSLSPENMIRSPSYVRDTQIAKTTTWKVAIIELRCLGITKCGGKQLQAENVQVNAKLALYACNDVTMTKMMTDPDSLEFKRIILSWCKRIKCVVAAILSFFSSTVISLLVIAVLFIASRITFPFRSI